MFYLNVLYHHLVLIDLMFSLIKFCASLNGYFTHLPHSTLFCGPIKLYIFNWVTCNLGNCHTADQSSQPKNSTKDLGETACPA